MFQAPWQELFVTCTSFKATVFCLSPAQPAVEAPKYISADKRKKKKSPFPCTRGKKEKSSIFHLLLLLSKRMREENGIISRWFSNCIMCSLEGLTLFGSKTYVLHILIGPIKLATLHDPLLPECWLCACLSSLRKWNKNKHVYNNFQGQVPQIRTQKCIYIW